VLAGKSVVRMYVAGVTAALFTSGVKEIFLEI